MDLYLDLKGFILSMIPMTNDAMHIYMGMSCYLATCIVFRRPLSWPPALLPGIVLSIIIEAIDIAYGSHWSWSLKDVLNTTFWPAVIVFVSGRLRHD